MEKQKGNAKRVQGLCAVTGMLLLFCLFASSLSALALNEDYLSPQKWAESRNVTETDICLISRGETLQGTFGMAKDEDNLCLYTHFSVDCTAFDENRDNARITFIVHTDNEDYTVSVDKDGPTDTPEGSLKALATAWNFDLRGSGEFFASVEYTGKEERCTVDVEFYANTKFVICENVVLERPVTTKPAKETTTKAPGGGSTNKSSAGNRKSSGSTASGGTRSGSSRASAGETVTKFVPQGNNYFTEPEPDEESTADVAKPGNTAVQGEKVMSSEARVLLLTGILLAAAGMMAALFAALRRKAPGPSADSDEAAETTDKSDEEA